MNEKMGKFMLGGLFGTMESCKAIQDLIHQKRKKGETTINIDELEDILSSKTVEGMIKFLEREEKNGTNK